MIDYKNIQDYLSSLCELHAKINSAGTDRLHYFNGHEQMQDFMKKAKSPHVISRAPDYNGAQNNADQYGAEVIFAFAIMSRYKPKSGQADIAAAKDEAMGIGLDFLKRIFKDSKKIDHLLYRTFSLADTNWEPREFPNLNLAGYEFVVSLKARMTMKENEDNWNNL